MTLAAERIPTSIAEIGADRESFRCFARIKPDSIVARTYPGRGQYCLYSYTHWSPELTHELFWADDWSLPLRTPEELASVELLPSHGAAGDWVQTHDHLQVLNGVLSQQDRPPAIAASMCSAAAGRISPQNLGPFSGAPLGARGMALAVQEFRGRQGGKA